MAGRRGPSARCRTPGAWACCCGPAMRPPTGRSSPMPDPAATQLWRLLPNRVPRFYTGGALLDGFLGEPGERPDTDRPEDWVGSATRAWTPPGSPTSDLGLGHTVVGGTRHRVADL